MREEDPFRQRYRRWVEQLALDPVRAKAVWQAIDAACDARSTGMTTNGKERKLP